MQRSPNAAGLSPRAVNARQTIDTTAVRTIARIIVTRMSSRVSTLAGQDRRDRINLFPDIDIPAIYAIWQYRGKTALAMIIVTVLLAPGSGPANRTRVCTSVARV
jgi:hypothetical protein